LRWISGLDTKRKGESFRGRNLKWVKDIEKIAEDEESLGFEEEPRSRKIMEEPARLDEVGV